jgi:biotin-dependent carboxylase-like uncharacterized protein
MTDDVRAVEVVRAGPLTTIQDRGRPGFAHLGVPRSGALDQPSLGLANRLVGNPDHAAALETTVGGVAVRTRTACFVAVTGAPAVVSVDDEPADWGMAIGLRAGQVLDVGPATTGVRSYVALSGGVTVEPVLGSRSGDVLSGLGPPPLRAGDVLPLGTAVALPAVAAEFAAHADPPDPLILRLMLGPRDEWFAEAASTLSSSTYVVSSSSNRIAIRLDGPPLERRTTDELPPEGVVLGALQVPADGEPLVFLADHPTTGGYPVVGVVHPVDLPRCAQARPGVSVHFHIIETRPLYGARR